MASNVGGSRKSLRGLVLASLLSASLSGPATASQEAGDVRISAPESLTGTFALFGRATMSGKIIAFDEINAAGGVTIDGKKVQCSVTPSLNDHDAGVDPAQTVTW